MEERIYIIVAKMLHGEASDEERRELDAWLEKDPKNSRSLEEMQLAWKEADALFDAPRFDAAPAWEKVALRMQPAAVTPKGRTMAFPSWTKYSAAVAAILLIALIIWSPFQGRQIEVAASSSDRQIELPDHSKIFIRQGSRISYPEKFASKERRVKLEGEAYFEVSRNEHQPFIIDAQAVDVRVLGTTFNVRCSPDRADVTVSTGRVQVTDQKAKNNSVVLLPGKKAHFEKGHLEQANANGYESLWKNNELVFESRPFSEVLLALSTFKDSSIQADSHFSAQQLSQPVTVTFKDQSLQDMLTELCLITNCRWDRRGATYIVQPK